MVSPIGFPILNLSSHRGQELESVIIIYANIIAVRICILIIEIIPETAIISRRAASPVAEPAAAGNLSLIVDPVVKHIDRSSGRIRDRLDCLAVRIHDGILFIRHKDREKLSILHCDRKCLLRFKCLDTEKDPITLFNLCLVDLIDLFRLDRSRILSIQRKPGPQAAYCCVFFSQADPQEVRPAKFHLLDTGDKAACLLADFLSIVRSQNVIEIDYIGIYFLAGSDSHGLEQFAEADKPASGDIEFKAPSIDFP